MTSNSSTRKKLRAAFLAFVMVMSVFGGTIAFSGSVAADTPQSVSSDETPANVTTPGGNNVTVADVTFSSPGNATNITVGLSDVDAVDVDAKDVNAVNVSLYNGSTFIQSNSTSFDSDPTEVNLTTSSDPTNVTNISRVVVTVQPASPSTVSPEGAVLDANLTLTEAGSGNTTNVSTENTQDIDVGAIDESTNRAVETSGESPVINVSFKSATGINPSSVDISVRNLNVSGNNETVLVQGGTVQGSASFTDASNFSTSSNTTLYANISAPTLQEGYYTVNATANTSNGNSFQNSTLTNRASNFSYDRSGVGLKVLSDDTNPLASNQANVDVVAVDDDGNALIFNESDVGATAANIQLSFDDPGNVTNVNRPTDSVRPILNTSAGGVYNTTFGVNYSEVGDLQITATDFGGNLTQGSATQTYTAQIAGVSVTSDANSVVADGSDTVDVTLQLVDQNGNPVPRSGVSTSFGIISGNQNAAGLNVTSQASGTTDSNGTDTIAYNATNKGYTIEVAGQTNNYQDRTTFDTVAGDVSPSTSTLQVNGTTGTTTETVATQHPVTVTLQDAQNNAIEGVTVDLSANVSGASFANAAPVTNSTGVATTTVTLPEQKGGVQINASAGAFNASATGNAQVNISTTAADVTALQFGSNAQTSIAPQSQDNSYTIEAVDEFGNVNTSTGSLSDVTLTSSDQGVLDFDGSASSAQPVNSGGTASFNVDANGTGTATLSATIPDANISNTTLDVSVASPGGLELTVNHNVATSDVTNSNTRTTATITAQLVDSSGSAVAISGENISFARQSGSAAELNQSLADFTKQTDGDGNVTIQVNGTTSTGTTTFIALPENYSVQGDVTVETTGAAQELSVTPASSTVTQDETTNVTVSFVDSAGRIVPRTQSVSISTDIGTFDDSSTSKTTAFNSNGRATAQFTYNGTETGQANLTALGGGVSGTATVTVEAPAGPVDYNASVTFNDTTVQNGTETVTVDSASYTADGSAADYVVVVHVVNDDGSISNAVGYSANQSGSAEDISVDLNASGTASPNSLTENTTLRAMLHSPAADSGFGSAIQVDGSTVTDDANITVEDDTVPTDPTERALQIAGVDNASQLTQNDVTIAITQFERGNNVNNIDITQDDVTTIITLFERDN